MSGCPVLRSCVALSKDEGGASPRDGLKASALGLLPVGRRDHDPTSEDNCYGAAIRFAVG